MASYLKINGYLLLYNGKLIKVPNLDPSNIKSGVEILGVIGTHSNPIDGITLNDGELEIYSSDEWNSAINVYKDNAYINVVSDNSATVNLGIDVEDWNPTITLNYLSGTITANNLTPDNIKSGVSILGVSGTYEGSGSGSIDGVSLDNGALTLYDTDRWNYININKSNTNINLRNDSTNTINLGDDLGDYHPTAQLVYKSGTVTSTNLTADNIKSGVSILGITGTYEGSSTSINGVIEENGTLVVENSTYYSSYVIRDVDNVANVVLVEDSNITLEASNSRNEFTLNYVDGTVVANNLTPENIKSGVSILGVTGTYEGNTPSVSFDSATGTLTITTSGV